LLLAKWRSTDTIRVGVKQLPTRQALQIRLRWLAVVYRRNALEQFGRVGGVDMDDGVELLGRAGIEIVALAFRLRQVDHADRALYTIWGRHY
jgi:hypothetical protein